MNDKITFPRLATLLADRSGRSKRFSEDFLREFFALISETLETGESVKVKGLGTFRLSRVDSRRSIDVTTGQPMEISGHSKVVFVPSKELAEAVNAPFEAFTSIEISDDADISQLFSSEGVAIQEEPEQAATDEEGEEENYTSGDKEDFLTSEIDDGTEEEIETALPDHTIEFTKPEEPSETATEVRIENLPEEEVPEIKIEENLEEDSQEVSKEEDLENESPEVIIEENPEEEDAEQPADENLVNKDDPAETETFEVAVIPAESVEPYEDDDELEFDSPRTRRKNWLRTLMIALGAAALALIGTLVIWYIYAANDYNSFFNRTASNSKPTEGFVVGKTITTADSLAEESTEDTESDAMSATDEPEVPTAPSDPIVYDTISTTRYLTTMAKIHYGNFNLWPYIYEENKGKLGHPDRIRPGTPVVIPKLSKYGVDPTNKEHVDKAKKLGVEIYARYGKKI